jgi:hypothetical protein
VCLALLGFVVVAVLLFVVWPRGLRPLFLYFLFSPRFLHTPLGAFGALAAIVFADGWYLRWPPAIGRCRPWRRGAMVLALVAILHTGWFLFGWVPFHPRCSYDVGVSLFATGRVVLIGDFDPVYADRFEEALAVAWGRAAVRRGEEYSLFIRPVFGLLTDDEIETLSYRVAGVTDVPPLGDESLEPCRTLERNAMAGGVAEDWREEWGVWPWVALTNSDFARWLRGLYR